MKKSINLSLSYPSFKLQLRSDEPLDCLKELKSILKNLNQNTEIIERMADEISNISNPDIIFNLEFSEDIRSNPEIVEQIDKLLQVEKDYHVGKAVFDCKKVVDLDNKHTCFELESDETSRK